MLAPEPYAIFPVINPTLNGASTILLLTGRWLISQRRIAQHRLTSYVYYHVHGGSVRLHGTGWTRPLDYFMLHQWFLSPSTPQISTGLLGLPL